MTIFFIFLSLSLISFGIIKRSEFYEHQNPGLKTHPQFALTQAQMGAGGTVMALDVGSKERAFRFMNALEIILISNNLGDSKSIITHPATTTHQRLPQAQKDLLGITSGLLRFSVGLESARDLEADLMAALDASGVEA